MSDGLIDAFLQLVPNLERLATQHCECALAISTARKRNKLLVHRQVLLHQSSALAVRITLCLRCEERSQHLLRSLECVQLFAHHAFILVELLIRRRQYVLKLRSPVGVQLGLHHKGVSD